LGYDARGPEGDGFAGARAERVGAEHVIGSRASLFCRYCGTDAKSISRLNGCGGATPVQVIPVDVSVEIIPL